MKSDRGVEASRMMVSSASNCAVWGSRDAFGGMVGPVCAVAAPFTVVTAVDAILHDLMRSETWLATRCFLAMVAFE